jgi:hypothetical protein
MRGQLPNTKIVYLVVRADGDMRLLKNRPSPMWGEWAVRLTVQLPPMSAMQETTVVLPGPTGPVVIEPEPMRELPRGRS